MILFLSFSTDGRTVKGPVLRRFYTLSTEFSTELMSTADNTTGLWEVT